MRGRIMKSLRLFLILSGFFAIAFLTSALHAESPGSAALKGATKGAAGGAGGQGPHGGPNDPADRFQQILKQQTQGQAARPNPQPSTGPKGVSTTSGSSQ